jgi:hypothetical protein
LALEWIAMRFDDAANFIRDRVLDRLWRALPYETRRRLNSR